MSKFIKITIAIVFTLITVAVAAPHSGDEYRLRQPDGSYVRVLVWGDEFYQDVESSDGFTLIRDSDGWICYAELSADGSEYVSTGVRYSDKSRAPGAQKKIRISQKSLSEKHRRGREALGYDKVIEPSKRPWLRKKSSLQPLSDGFSPAPAAPGKVVGLTLLVNFLDVKANVTQAMVEDFLNRSGGANGANPTGSVKDYFFEVSNGNLEYENIVVSVTLDKNKSYYDVNKSYHEVSGLNTGFISDALNNAKNMGVDLSRLTVDNGVAVALNIFYAGSPDWGWTMGLWPHMGWYSGGVTINGIGFQKYQMTSLGSENAMPGIGTFVHENGHLVMGWPDLYNYDNSVTNVVSRYCVMSYQSSKNPQIPNPYFRDLAGWINVTDITGMNARLTHTANSHEAYQYRRNAQESYYIETRRRAFRDADLLGEGLVVWHIHENGINTRLSSSNPYPLVKVVQANNSASTTTAFPSQLTEYAPFRAGGGSNNTSFNKFSSPAARYYDGTFSEINITDIGELDISLNSPVMHFSIGEVIMPIITTQPASGSTIIGTAYNMSVAAKLPATGGTLSYQWYNSTSANNSSGTPISGATNSSYSVPASTNPGLYYYYVVVTNTLGGVIKTVTSNAVSVTVYSQNVPIITAQPTSGLTTTGMVYTMSVAANLPLSGGLLSYQWYRNTSASNSGGSPIFGATNSSYSIPESTNSGLYYYYVIVANTQGNIIETITSDVATVTVHAKRIVSTAAEFYQQIAAYAMAKGDIIIDVAQNLKLNQYVDISVLTAAGRTLTIRSADPDKPVTLTRGVSGALFTVSNRATLILENIIIDGDSKGSFENGGGVLVTISSGGTLVTKDGAVLRNNANLAATSGGVAVAGIFTMNGGTISGNTSTEGGGVRVSGTDAVFTMNGGIVSGNTATTGSGIRRSSGTVNLNGGVVSGIGAGISNVVNGTYTLNAGDGTPNNAVIIAWNKPTDGPYIYSQGSSTNLVTSQGVTAVWGNKDSKSGILYKNNDNESFIEIAGVMIITYGTSAIQPQFAKTIQAHSANKTIILQNLPANAKVEVYNLSGKCIYSTNSENSKSLKIGVQTKGVYIVKAGNQTLRVAVR